MKQSPQSQQTIALNFPDYPAAPPFSAQAANEFLQRLVNRANLSFAPQFKTDEEKQILYFQGIPETSWLRTKKDIKDYARVTQNQLRTILQSLTRAELYQLFNPALTNPPQNGWYLGDQHLSEENCENIVYMREDAAGNPVIHVNYAILFGLLFPAPITLLTHESTEDIKEIEIDTRLLLLQLGQLFRQRVLFKVEGEGDNKIATPIFFQGMEAQAPKPLWLRVLVDMSASMAKDLVEYKERIINMVEELRKQPDSHDAIIEFIPFGINKKKPQLYKLPDSRISYYIKNLTATDQGTALFQTVLDGLSDDEIVKISKEYQVAVVIFTDGADNNLIDNVRQINTEAQSKLKQWCLELPAEANTPAVFAFGLGHHYDAALMDDLVKTICATFRKIDELSPENFAAVLDLCKKFYEAGKLYSIFQDLADEIRFVLFPGQVKVVGKTIRIDEPFSINRKQVQLEPAQFSVPSSASAPPAVAETEDSPYGGLSIVTIIGLLLPIAWDLLSKMINSAPSAAPEAGPSPS